MGAAESSCCTALCRGVDHAGEGPRPGPQEAWRQNGTGVIRQAQHGQVKTGLWHTASRYVGCLSPSEAGLLMPWATSVPGLPALSVLFLAEARPVSEVLFNGGKPWRCHTDRDEEPIRDSWAWGGGRGRGA